MNAKRQSKFWLEDWIFWLNMIKLLPEHWFSNSDTAI